MIKEAVEPNSIKRAEQDQTKVEEMWAFIFSWLGGGISSHTTL